MKRIYIIWSLSIILTFFFGYFISDYRNKQTLPAGADSGQNDTYAAGWEAARQRLRETGVYFVDTAYPIKEIWGEIKNIDGNKLILAIAPLDPLADPALNERLVIVDNKAALQQIVMKGESEYNIEVAAYNDKFKDAINGPILPEPFPNRFEEKQASFGNFEIGQKIKVETENDVRDVKEFLAQTIVIQYSNN